MMGAKKLTRLDVMRLAESDPTAEQFGAYSEAFHYFNAALFDGALPRCVLNFSRAANSLGFFAPERWANHSRTTHEISLNPDLLTRPLMDTMSTLVHEMVHLWQQVYGDPPRRCYHNKQWAEKMESIGLMPSSTGEPGGKKTGQSMDHYIVFGGPFARFFDAMPERCLLPWRSGAAGADEKKPPKPRKDKVKYTCPECDTNVWGKAGLSIFCVACEVVFECELPEDLESDRPRA